jgi:tetraacyldisaccharide 4'-kinase
MVRNWLLKILLLPFSLLYGIGVILRDLFYKFGLLKSVEFNVPVISVGNISIGGTGKTPHIEYLISGLREHLKVATLSRGYGRKTKGYLAIDPRMSADKAGDEPLQFKRKYPDIPVIVSESRTFGIVQMLQQYPGLQCILLDDAFQHRSVQPGLNILLTSFNEPYNNDFLLPVGRLREWPSGANRANAIIVTKCPMEWDPSKREGMLKKIKPKEHQQVFFSRFKYHYPYSIFDPQQRIEIGKDRDIIVLSAIANTNYMMDFLEHFDNTYHEMSFTDHHLFTANEISQIVQKFEHLSSGQKMILTTEKDAVRLEPHLKYLYEKQIPVFVLPVSVEFLDGDKERFDDYVKDFLLNFTV